MIHQDIVPLEQINNIVAMHNNPDILMIQRFPIIQIEDHHQCYGIDQVETNEELDKFHSLEYLLDAALFSAELKVIEAKTPA